VRGLANWGGLAFFSVFWLLPVAWWGATGDVAPFCIPGTERMTSGFGLFIFSQDFVPLQYIQVLLPGASDWTTENERDYLPMSPFGDRTRLDEMLRKSLDSEEALVELAAFVRRRHVLRTGVDPVAIRFVAGVILPSRRPSGRFRKPPLDQIDPIRRWAWWVRSYRRVPPELLQRHP